MKKYFLNLGAHGRILSVGKCLEGQTSENVVNTFPDGNVADYRYENGEYIHDPLPKPQPTAQEPTVEELLNIILGIGGETNEQ